MNGDDTLIAGAFGLAVRVTAPLPPFAASAHRGAGRAVLAGAGVAFGAADRDLAAVGEADKTGGHHALVRLDAAR